MNQKTYKTTKLDESGLKKTLLVCITNKQYSGQIENPGNKHNNAYVIEAELNDKCFDLENATNKTKFAVNNLKSCTNNGELSKYWCSESEDNIVRYLKLLIKVNKRLESERMEYSF